MRACMVAYTFYETDNRVRRYAETLVKQGYEVDAIVLRREGQPSFGVVKGVNVYRIQGRVRDERGPFNYLRKLLMFFARSSWTLTWKHLKKRYDLIHVHSVPDFQVFCALVPRIMGAKVILDIHDIVPELYASKFGISQQSLPFRMLLWMEWLSARFSNHVIIANHLWHERFVKRSSRPGDCSTILNYPDLTIFDGRPRSAANGKFLLCYPGTLSSHQGVDLVIRAMAPLRDHPANVHFLVLGDGAERDNLIALAAECGLAERVTIVKGVPIEQVAETMAKVDLGVEPKRKSSFANEALSTKILEFMAMGVPVLASDTIVHEMYFKDRVEFFKSEDIPAFTAALLALIENPARRDELRNEGTKLIAEYNWEENKGEYLDLVERLVGPRKEFEQ